MPIKHSALKQLRKDAKRRERNNATRSELRTMTKRAAKLIQANQLEEARQALRQLAGQFDRAAKKGVIHRNRATRFKSRLARRLNRTAAA